MPSTAAIRFSIRRCHSKLENKPFSSASNEMVCTGKEWCVLIDPTFSPWTNIANRQ